MYNIYNIYTIYNLTTLEKMLSKVSTNQKLQFNHGTIPQLQELHKTNRATATQNNANRDNIHTVHVHPAKATTQ